jgi:hypothetical protein
MTIKEQIIQTLEQLTPEQQNSILQQIKRYVPDKVGGHVPKIAPYGALKDLGQAPSAEDIDEARREMWANFPREDI